MEFAQNSIQKIKEKLENIFSVVSLESSTQISDQHTQRKTSIHTSSLLCIYI